MNLDELTTKANDYLLDLTDLVIADQDLCLDCSERIPPIKGDREEPDEDAGCKRVENYSLCCKHIHEYLRQRYGR